MMKRGKFQKYVKSKIPTKPEVPLRCKNQRQDKIKQVRTSKSGELVQNLRVVSFSYFERNEK